MADIQQPALSRHISPLSAWALSIGTSIGWGSFVITSNTYLSSAGPLGSALGMGVGAAVMLLITANYYKLMKRWPEAGGVYSYVKNVFGPGDSFLVAWYLGLTYLAMLWANATSLPLFARYFLGDVFCVGRLYTLFGYEVWFGEALLSILALLLFAFLCMKRGQLALRLNAALALLFTLGIAVCFVGALVMRGDAHSFEPRYVPDSSSLSQIMRIAFISPWAFVGFENISHAAEEFSFPVRRSFRVLTVSVVVTTLLYIFVTLLSVSAYPARYESWLAYIRDLNNISGLEGLPAFYAAQFYLGSAGVWLLMLSLLALIFTSLIGNIYALSRLIYAMAADHVLPARFARLSRRGTPENAIAAVALVSLFIPFLGRTCIGWIVDVTTLGATIVYGVVSGAARQAAKKDALRFDAFCGTAGLVIMLVFAAFLLMPNLYFGVSMEMESYFIFILWSILGLFFFRYISDHDASRRFDSAIHVWVALLVMIVLMGVMWMSKVYEKLTLSTILNIRNYYSGTQLNTANYASDPFMFNETTHFHSVILRLALSVLGLFALSLSAMLWNYTVLRRRAQETSRELGTARSMAYTDPLTGVKSKQAYVEYESRYDTQIDEQSIDAFGIIVADINGTKHINDTLGHRAGDAYICAGCMILCRCFKSSPVFRIGGDEFVVILQGTDYERRAELIADVNAVFERNIGTGEVVAALGLGEYRPGEDRTFHAVFERADTDMYDRKRRLKDLGAKVRD